MKHFKKQALSVVIILSMVFVSCSSSDDSDGDIKAASGILVANVDGASYKSFEISSSATISNVSSTAKSLMIIATNSDGKAFSMTVFGYEGAGTYDFTGANLAITNVASYSETDVNINNPTASTTEIWQAPYDDTKVGSITITEETDTKIKGTFSFTCKNVNGNNSIKNITEGSFDLNKQVL